MSNKLQELKKQIEALREESKNEAKRLIETASKDIFANFPELQAISWRQYTPYFNDGDPCTFSACNEYPDMVLEINGEEHVLEDASAWTLKGDYLGEVFWPYRAQLQAVQEWISQFDDDELLAIYGDHVTVTIGRGGVSVDEYDHA